MKVLQVTDCHLLPSGQTIFGSDPGERLQACIADINRHHRDADLCVFTGDLAHHADMQAYALLRELVGQLAIPYRLMVGNHDSREGLLAAFPETPVDENGFVQSVLDGPDGRLIFLDTIEASIHTGVFCEARRRWLKARLTEASGSPAYLFMHHPPFPIEVPQIDQYGMAEADRAALGALLERHRNVRHIFAGHVHRPVAGGWRGIPVNALRGTNHQTWLDFGSRQANICSLEPPAYAVAFLSAETTIVHFHDFLDANPKYLYDPSLPAAEQVRAI